ncbi:MAG: hypothetical protein AB7E51_05125 [Pseudodesulfovibrio sp.]|jgi:hypothetical protein|uniref:Uncharacterized protein n=1 Tax=Pseudodesulfovibrio indicus TaxID=1716143 RepID=A0A126QQP5_9BACT|nr:hypothetical protein [Pseudodesulfovibrio indicus]AMK12370.1 hypothetical protein AWY79_15290 [Pseudodesulfovibrio indicus]TDT90660.1 hypothetical protein EDC59_10290 [Pseudodesulfovibrio indicus]
MDDNKPFLTEDGTLVIPFECSDNAYKYWKQEGKAMTEILKELNVSPEVWAKYTHEPYPTDDAE